MTREVGRMIEKQESKVHVFVRARERERITHVFLRRRLRRGAGMSF